MAKEKRATWFKMFLHHKRLVYAYSAEDVGNGLKAAFAYFEAGEVPEDLSPNAFSIFLVMQEYIDEAIADYEKSVEDGKKGGRPKKNNNDK